MTPSDHLHWVPGYPPWLWPPLNLRRSFQVPTSIFWRWWVRWHIPTIPARRRIRLNSNRKDDSSDNKDFQEAGMTNSQVTSGRRPHPADLQSHCPSKLTRLSTARPLRYHLCSLFRHSLKGLVSLETPRAAPLLLSKGKKVKHYQNKPQRKVVQVQSKNQSMAAGKGDVGGVTSASWNSYPHPTPRACGRASSLRFVTSPPKTVQVLKGIQNSKMWLHHKCSDLLSRLTHWRIHNLMPLSCNIGTKPRTNQPWTSGNRSWPI